MPHLDQLTQAVRADDRVTFTQLLTKFSLIPTLTDLINHAADARTDEVISDRLVVWLPPVLKRYRVRHPALPDTTNSPIAHAVSLWLMMSLSLRRDTLTAPLLDVIEQGGLPAEPLWQARGLLAALMADREVFYPRLATPEAVERLMTINEGNRIDPYLAKLSVPLQEDIWRRAQVASTDPEQSFPRLAHARRVRQRAQWLDTQPAVPSRPRHRS